MNLTLTFIYCLLCSLESLLCNEAPYESASTLPLTELVCSSVGCLIWGMLKVFRKMICSCKNIQRSSADLYCGFVAREAWGSGAKRCDGPTRWTRTKRGSRETGTNGLPRGTGSARNCRKDRCTCEYFFYWISTELYRSLYYYFIHTLNEVKCFLMFQGKLASEQHIRELCGSMIDGERSLFVYQLRSTVVMNKCKIKG